MRSSIVKGLFCAISGSVSKVERIRNVVFFIS